MSFDADEEILQDFLVEAGEILEQLSEQLVELESRPDDMDLLNAIFRGFHTVKGGAGFLQLHTLVECCHIAENVFDILRKGERRVDAELMDVVLQALDSVNEMFGRVREREEPQPASPELLAALARLAEPAGSAPAAAPVPEPVVAAPVAAPAPPPAAAEAAEPELSDADFQNLLDALGGEPSAERAPDVAAPSAAGGEDITDDEFEALLDQLHGKGKFSEAPAPAATATVAAPAPAAAAGDDISDDEFEALLDELHGKGKFATAEAPAPVAAAATPAVAAGDEITDDEFESLLDELHGKGKFSGPAVAAEPVASSVAAAPAAAAPTPTPAPVAKPAPVAAEPPKPAAPAPAAAAGERPTSEAETTVRVDTARLDEIMNMVGELVLVRNRLVRLGLNSGDEAMAKAVSNLDVVTADLQTSVMKTRMQPIKKVFGRFPRLVRDLARSLKKEINLELVGEETDLDKNLVEALADPLVHLVRNAVDHGIEGPAEREENGKSRAGRVVLSAEQEGDHILLSISDDGKGMDADLLRNKAVEKGLLDRDAADRLTET